MHELSRVALGMTLQAAVLHKKNGGCLAEEQWSHPWTSKNYQLPGSFSCRARYSPCKGTSRQDRTAGTTTELPAAAGSRERPHTWGDSSLREARTGVKARTSSNHSFPPYFSLAAANWQSQLFLFSPSLSCGFAYAAEQTGASFVVLAPVRIWSTVLG